MATSTLYVFEKAGLKEDMDPKEVLLRECRLLDDATAIKLAKTIKGCVYVWKTPENSNPIGVWRKGVTKA